MTTKSLTELPMVQKVVEVVAVIIALFVFAVYCSQTEMPELSVFSAGFLKNFVLGIMLAYTMFLLVLVVLYIILSISYALVVHVPERHWFRRAIHDIAVFIDDRVLVRYFLYHLW